LEAYYGLDRPLSDQFGRYLSDLAHGDLGVSIRYNVPVSALVKERLPWTLLLIGSAMALAVGVGWAAGIHSAWKRGRGVDQGLLCAFLTVHSFPTFFVASLTVLIFSVKLGWFPVAGARTPFSPPSTAWRSALDVGHHLTLPAIVLALGFVAGDYLTMRASMVGELEADYLLLGRAKGVSDRRLKYRYAARNALLPTVTLSALQLGFAVTESVVVETVFAYQGMGRLLFEAVSFRDYPVLAGCFLILSLIVVTLNFGADTLYRRLDPRTSK
jgi:peptide/nickel transport system permease protein